MHKIDTGSESGNRLLDTIISYGLAKVPHQVDDWLAGDIEMDFLFTFLARNSNMDAAGVVSVLEDLAAAGYIQAHFDRSTLPNARISLSLPAGARLAG